MPEAVVLPAGADAQPASSRNAQGITKSETRMGAGGSDTMSGILAGLGALAMAHPKLRIGNISNKFMHIA